MEKPVNKEGVVSAIATGQEVENTLRGILQNSPGGIFLSTIFNHPQLSEYSRQEIDDAFNREISEMNIKLGAAATRYYWVGPTGSGS